VLPDYCVLAVSMNEEGRDDEVRIGWSAGRVGVCTSGLCYIAAQRQLERNHKKNTEENLKWWLHSLSL
jgi:hypothetical protein